METFLSELYILVSKFRFFDSRRIHPVFENCCFSGILADFAESPTLHFSGSNFAKVSAVIFPWY